MGRPKEPWKRERLLDAAMSTMVDKGLGGVTVKDVADAAGVSPGTVHYHFSDIDGVLLGVVERALDKMYDQRLDAISAVPDIRSKLLTLIELGLPDEISHEVTLLYEAISVVRSRTHFHVVIKSYVDRQVSLYRSVIDSGVSTGDFTPGEPVDVIARNLLAMEDAYGLYVVVGAMRDSALGRINMRTYASRVLAVSLGDD
ncbi:MAG: TetR/AcrR family transcriptional regulator [Actinobacteria bacterium]|nr:TetR/AcrR family transcriptional regulator [Actinomycetota bacterium]